MEEGEEGDDEGVLGGGGGGEWEWEGEWVGGKEEYGTFLRGEQGIWGEDVTDWYVQHFLALVICLALAFCIGGLLVDIL